MTISGQTVFFIYYFLSFFVFTFDFFTFDLSIYYCTGVASIFDSATVSNYSQSSRSCLGNSYRTTFCALRMCSSSFFIVVLSSISASCLNQSSTIWNSSDRKRKSYRTVFVIFRLYKEFYFKLWYNNNGVPTLYSGIVLNIVYYYKFAVLLLTFS